MSKVRSSGPETDVTDTLSALISTICRYLAYAGALALLVGVGFLIFHIVMFSGNVPPQGGIAENAPNNINLFRKILAGGFVAFVIGSAVLWWGEDWMPIMQIIIAALLSLAPVYIPSFMSPPINETAAQAIAGLQQGGLPGAALALGVLVLDVIIRVQGRMRVGVKADQLKYGKGIKEDVDRNNVFMGKCWQLPYCRKFVRERCPIYHARRSCWREKVGCMCEEEVIKGAMENRAIPKNLLAAAKYIPRNNKLTEGQKRDRCRQCIIYNEHQKHKYRLMMPLTLIGFIAVYALGRPVFLEATKDLVDRIDALLGVVTYGQAGGVKAPDGFQELLLVCLFVVLFAYSLKLLEFLVFKLKV